MPNPVDVAVGGKSLHSRQAVVAAAVQALAEMRWSREMAAAEDASSRGDAAGVGNRSLPGVRLGPIVHRRRVKVQEFWAVEIAVTWRHRSPPSRGPNHQCFRSLRCSRPRGLRSGSCLRPSPLPAAPKRAWPPADKQQPTNNRPDLIMTPHESSTASKNPLVLSIGRWSLRKTANASLD